MPENQDLFLDVYVLRFLLYQNMDIHGGRQYVVWLREFGISQEPKTFIYECIENLFCSSNLCRALYNNRFKWNIYCRYLFGG